MSFKFEWPSFSDSFKERSKTILETALNKGNTPALIVGKIEVRELDMGVIVSALDPYAAPRIERSSPVLTRAEDGGSLLGGSVARPGSLRERLVR
jgi:hypothetical protein